jgi:putative tryptophan/tyrosine transport system substrate-binding protein
MDARITRRAFGVGLGLGLLGAGRRLGAQPAKPARIGWVSAGSQAGASVYLDSFREGLRELGHIEGRTYSIETRWAAGSAERGVAFTEELVGQKVDLLVSQGPVFRAVKQAGGTTPILFGMSSDPVEAGIVASLARPGGNITGRTFLAVELVGKRLELLKEAWPDITSVAIVSNPNHAGEQAELRESETAARNLGLTTQAFRARNESEMGVAFEAMTRAKAQGLVVFPDAVMLTVRKALADYSIKRRIPCMGGWSQFAEAGALLTYGPNLVGEWRRLAVYADRILKGARPADLPVEQPTRFELVVNLDTAQRLGRPLPASLLQRADRVIQN